MFVSTSEVSYIEPNTSEIHVRNETLVQTEDFVYLGSTVSDNARLYSEITFRMGKASAVYAKLRETVGQPPCVAQSERQGLSSSRTICPAIWCRNVDHESHSGEKAACIYDAPSDRENEHYMGRQNHQRRNLQKNGTEPHGRYTNREKSQMDWSYALHGQS